MKSQKAEGLRWVVPFHESNTKLGGFLHKVLEKAKPGQVQHLVKQPFTFIFGKILNGFNKQRGPKITCLMPKEERQGHNVFKGTLGFFVANLEQ